MAAEAEAPVIKSSPYASPLYNMNSSIIQMTSAEDELFKMELTFRNATTDDKGNLKELGQPLMNDVGISSIIGIVQSLVNRVTIMSNLNKQEIPMIMDFIGDTISKDLMMNRVRYNIQSTTARDKIYFSALATAFTTMKRAYEEGEKRFWKGSTQEITTRIDGGNNRNKGMLGALMGWKKQ